MLDALFKNNVRWADAIKDKEPDFFEKLAQQQSPQLLWIGCADSRVPANEIMGLAPGEVFVHRNVANLVVHTDMNCLSVLQYAVEVLKVRHILVTGHYGCGGVKAALDNLSFGLIDNWLQHIKDIHRYHASRFDGLSYEAKLDLLCELNVVEQVANVANTTILKSAWAKGQDVSVHGLIFSISDGILRDLGVHCSASQPTPSLAKAVLTAQGAISQAE
ncbi:carbonate dehydratase [Paraperlucidibaca wandonensis]|jgi:carbonic anhydrase|uniref:Carbonic anhydrase n=1 Tax=Paraperlucidibaca wandonensis TaxID=1268273 RepID=A0ABW3HBH9_9GAMM|nr:carbonate dehydratase [Paraperlucidibaca sp.]MBQ0723393.1 carbonate dehydratase [Paraperlucidibaca sp.]MBQ0842937.1 carbonate dehydratase [Paraperlucidibaca sp.]|tara:strand:+ start:1347 stop:2000 length:654 start_codon:yes stop_codon:yes gene_type:complete